MEIFNEVTKVLSMKNPYIVAVPPERHNIMYSVVPKKDLDEVADMVHEKLQFCEEVNMSFPKAMQ